MPTCCRRRVASRPREPHVTCCLTSQRSHRGASTSSGSSRHQLGFTRDSPAARALPAAEAPHQVHGRT